MTSVNTKLVRSMTEKRITLEFNYDHYDHTLTALYGNMRMPTREEFEELVKLWRRFYDITPSGFAEKWNEASERRWAEDLATTQKKQGFVYLAHADTGHYKIGLSIGPVDRIKVFDTQMPVTVSLIHAFACDDMRTAESLLHEHYKQKRYVGEWFNLSDEDVKAIENIAVFENGEFFYRGH